MADADTPLAVALTGAFGGAAPALLALADRYQVEGWLPGNVVASEVAAICIFGSISIVIVKAFKETNMMKAFFLGIGAPALVLNMTPLVKPSQTTGIMLIRPWIAPPAHAAAQSPAAQSPAERSSEGNRSLTIEVHPPYIRDYSIFYLEDPEKAWIKIDDGDKATVPTTSIQVCFKGTLAGKRLEPSPTVVGRGSDDIVLRLEWQQTFWGGLLDGFGFDDNVAWRYAQLSVTQFPPAASAAADPASPGSRRPPPPCPAAALPRTDTAPARR